MCIHTHIYTSEHAREEKQERQKRQERLKRQERQEREAHGRGARDYEEGGRAPHRNHICSRNYCSCGGRGMSLSHVILLQILQKTI